MSFIRAPPKDTRAYHPNAPKRATSFVSQNDQVLPAPRLIYEGNKEYDEARRAFSSQQNTSGTASKEVQGCGRTRSRSPSHQGGKDDAHLFPPTAFPNSGMESTVDDDDLPNPPSLDGSSTSQPRFIASRGNAVPPIFVVSTAPGGYVLDGDSKAYLTVATKVMEDDEDDTIFRPHAYYYDGDDKKTLTMTNNKRHWCIIASCCVVMLGGVFAIALVLVIQSSRGPRFNASQMDSAPTFSPSTSGEAVFMKGMSAIVGDGVFEENSYLERAANWMMNDDPMALGPFDPTFLQRFLLAVFYFSTTDSMAQTWQSCSAPVADEATDCSYGILMRQADDSLDYEYQSSFRWLSAESECVWAGVTCSEGHVNSITLAGQNMTGTLPVEVSLLPFLQSLSLHYNEFTGSIPVDYGRMRYLVNLDLHGNQLSGSIPNDLYENDILEQINIGENHLSGTISTLVGQLTSLKGFHVNHNQFKGSIPEEIGKLRFLTHTRWDNNHFVGSIPTSIAQLTSLVELWLQGNALTASIPSQLAALQGLEDLQLFENRFIGRIPEVLYDMLNLRRLELSSNDLSGTISTRIGQLLDLTDFRVARNALTGTIPSQLSILTNLRIVWLHMNKFEGEVPQALCNIVGEGFLQYLNADCGPEDNPANPCDCCTGCCDRTTEICLLTNLATSD